MCEKVDFDGSQWDRLMFYEVTGRKLKGDGYALESCSSDEEACKGTDSDIGSPKG